MKRNTFYSFTFIFVLFILTNNIFSQWISFPALPLLSGPNGCISAAAPNIVWAAGGGSNSPKVMRSTDGGITFTNVTGNMISTPELWSIWAVDQNTAYVGDGGAPGGQGGNAKVWKTTNGGVNWNVILTTGGTTGFINDIVFSRTMPNVGYIESDPPNNPGSSYWVQKTTDGGNTWSLIQPSGVTNMASASNSMAVIDDQFVAFGLGNNPPARIRYTTNGGTTWQLTATDLVTGGYVSGLAVKSDKQIWTCAIGGTGASLPFIARSTDAGTTWSTINTGSGLAGYCSMKWVYGTNVCYMTGGTGANGCARKSTDGGATWITQTTAGIQNLNNLDIVYAGGTVYAYAISSDGTVIKLVELIQASDPNNTTVPKDYSLEQNYPNPFNPATSIKYSIPKSSFVTLKIYDVLGNEVKTIVNTRQEAGNYVENIDASSLSSGVYFYTLRAGDYMETKKMSLVK